MAAPLTYPEHARAMLKLGLPIIGANLAFVAIGFTDTVLLGRYAVEALAAQVLGWSVYLTLYLVGTGIAQAVMPLVATHAEMGETVELRRVTRMGLWASMAFGLAVLPVLVSGNVLFRLIGQTPAVIPDAARYMAILGIGIFPGLAAMVLRSYLAALERTQVLLWVNVGAAVMNAGLGYALIFGRLGAPELGLEGAAIAAVVTTTAMLLALAAYVQRIAPEHALFRRLWRVDVQALSRVVRLGAPIGLTYLAEVALFTGGTVMMGWLGTVPLAAHGIALQLTSLTFTVHVAISNAATVRIGRAQGRGDVPGVRRGGAVAVGLSLMMSALAITAFVSAPRLLAGVFIGPDEAGRAEIVEVTRILLFLAAAFQAFDGLQAVGLGLLRGVQDTRVPMVIATVSYLCLGIPASYLFGFGLGLGSAGIWTGLVVGLAAAAVALMLRFRARVR